MQGKTKLTRCFGVCIYACVCVCVPVFPKMPLRAVNMLMYIVDIRGKGLCSPYQS